MRSQEPIENLCLACSILTSKLNSTAIFQLEDNACIRLDSNLKVMHSRTYCVVIPPDPFQVPSAY